MIHLGENDGIDEADCSPTSFIFGIESGSDSLIAQSLFMILHFSKGIYHIYTQKKIVTEMYSEESVDTFLSLRFIIFLFPTVYKLRKICTEKYPEYSVHGIFASFILATCLIDCVEYSVHGMDVFVHIQSVHSKSESQDVISK